MTDGRVGRVEGEKSLILIESAREQVYAPHLRSEQSDAKTIREAKAQSLNEGKGSDELKRGIEERRIESEVATLKGKIRPRSRA